MLEATLFQVSQGIVGAALDVWSSRRNPNQSLAQLLDEQVPSAVERRRLERTFEEMQVTVAKRLAKDAGSGNLPDHERAAAISAASDSFAYASLNQEDLLNAAMSPSSVANIVRDRSRLVRRKAGLSEGADRLCDLLVDEMSAVLVQLVASLPNWNSRALTHLLRQQEELNASLKQTLDQFPSPASLSQVDRGLDSYRRSVISVLDRTDNIGFPGSAGPRFRLTDTFVRPNFTVASGTVPMDWAVADHPRLFIVGPAGSGKTSALRSIAVGAARMSLDGISSKFNEYLPMYVQLRRGVHLEAYGAGLEYLAKAAFPALDSEEMLVLLRERCEAGKVIFLFDGLDEIEPHLRSRWLEWFAGFLNTYPNNRFLVTSRVRSFGEGFVDHGFSAASVDGLNVDGTAKLIRQWFAAADGLGGHRSVTETAEQAASLTRLIAVSYRLRHLAASPLMCALMCSIYHERGALPLRGADIYSHIVDLLVERRDAERGIRGLDSIPKPEALILLGELAKNMVILGVQDVTVERARAVLQEASTPLVRLQIDGSEIFDHLRARSGLLIEPSYGRIQFINVALMEYLAAQSFLESDQVGTLVEHAHDATWRSVVVLAAAQARPWQAEQLARGLLSRCQMDSDRGVAIASTLQESVASMVRLSPALREDCRTVLPEEGHVPSHVLRVRMAGTLGQAHAHSLYDWLVRERGLGDSESFVVLNAVEPNPTLTLIGDDRPDRASVVRGVIDWWEAARVGGALELVISEESVKVSLSEE
jgi:hypothetical protein